MATHPNQAVGTRPTDCLKNQWKIGKMDLIIIKKEIQYQPTSASIIYNIHTYKHTDLLFSKWKYTIFYYLLLDYLSKNKSYLAFKPVFLFNNIRR